MSDPRIGQVWEIHGSIEVITGWDCVARGIHSTFVICRVDDAAGYREIQVDIAKENVLRACENGEPTAWVRLA